MKVNSKFISIIFTTILLFSSIELFAQEALKPRKSPLDIVTLKYEDLYIKITYGRPHKRGRVIFGDLVPYGKIWRTGANEATEITLTKDVLINKKRLKAGTYTIFTVPDKKKWQIIFNSDHGLWGSYNYNPDKNVLVAEAPVSETNTVYEPFTIELQLQDDSANLIMIWEETKVALPIKFIK